MFLEGSDHTLTILGNAYGALGDAARDERALEGLLDETGLSEIEIEKDGQRVRIARELPDVRAAASLAAPADPIAAVAPPGSSFERTQPVFDGMLARFETR